MTEAKTQNCPRRMDEPRPQVRSENLDTWRDNGTCSYCGSLNPDEAMRRIEAGEAVGPTDKSYKIYLPGGKAYFQHFDEGHKRRLIELVNEKKVTFEHPGHFYVLPFFMKRK